MLDTNVKSCQFMSWRLSLHFSYCQLRCAHVLSCQAMKRHVKSWQSMSSNVKSCHGDYPLVSHIVSSGVHFNLKKRQNPESEFNGVELESKFILKKVVSMTAHVHTWADNIRNEGKIATKCTPELTIWETRGKLPQSTHLSWQYEKWGDNRHDMTWHGLSWLDMAFHGLTGQHMCTPELTIWETRGKLPQSSDFMKWPLLIIRF